VIVAMQRLPSYSRNDATPFRERLEKRRDLI
jgi:hypothetical protein